MRRVLFVPAVLAACMALTATIDSASAQGPGGMPGMPMQRMGPAVNAAGAGLGAPGAPMARMGRTGPSRAGGMPQSAAPARRNYAGLGGVPGVMSSQNFTGSNVARQFSGAGIQRSSSAIIGSATRGAVSVPSNGR